MFSVIWTARALDLLADYYVAVSPSDRIRMAGGVEALNEQLSTDPFEVGESRSQGFRVTFAPFLMIGFHVDLPSRTVHVRSIKRFGS